MRGTNKAVNASTYQFINFANIMNPDMVKSTGTFTFTLNDASSNVIARSAGTVNIPDTRIDPGTITMSSFLMSTSQVQAAAVSYTFDFVPAHDLKTNGTHTPKIVVEVPSGITLAASPTCSMSNTVGIIVGTATCTQPSNGALKRIEIDNPFNGATFTGGSQIRFTISGFTNSPASGSAGTLNVQTALKEVAGTAYYVVDQYSSTADVTMVPGSISATTPVTVSSATAYNAPTTYTIKFTPQHTTVAGGKVKVTLPTGIEFSDTASAQSGCAINTAGLTTPTCAVAGQTITFSNMFGSNFTSAEIQVSIPGIRNIRYQGTSDSFTIQTTDGSDNIIDQVSNNVQAITTAVAEISSATVVI